MGRTQPHMKWVVEALSLGVKLNTLPPSSVEVKIGGAVPPFTHMYSWHHA